MIEVQRRERLTEVSGPNSEQNHHEDEGPYIKASEVAAMLRVSPKTVSRWAKEGKLPHIKTLGGHRRFPERAIRRLIEELSQDSEG